MIVEIRTTIVTKIHENDLQAIGVAVNDLDLNVLSAHVGNLIMSAAQIGDGLVDHQNAVLDNVLPEDITIVGLPSATTVGSTKVTINADDDEE